MAESTIDKLARQILASSDSSKWQGEGFGSAEKNAADMAKIFSSVGITDLSQFGEIKQTVQGDPIYSDGAGEDRYVVGYGPDKEITTYGNKETGQALANTYGERQTGNAWGGTYAGEGNTAYRVQFDASGNPAFYTTEASSNTLAGLLDNPILSIAANVAAGVFGGPAGVAALQLAQGKSLKDAAKAAALAYAGGELSKALKAGVTDPSALSAAADADIAAGMIPEYGTNAAYDAAVSDIMANSPGAIDQLGSTGNSQVGGTIGPDNIDVGDGWNPASEVNAEDIYSNEGRNYPTTQSTQGSGGSPVNASTASSWLTLNNALNAARLASLVAGAVSAATPEDSSGFGIVPVPADWKTPDYQKYSPTLVELKGVDPMANLLAGTQFDPLAQMTLLPTSIASPNLDYIRGLLGQTNTSSMGK